MNRDRVPAADLRAQFRQVEADVRAAIDRVLESQQFVLGHESRALEAAIAEYSGTVHAVGVSSGTDALLVALMALGVGPGDEVVTTPYTFVATGSAIARLGARPVFVDIDPLTYNLDASRLADAMGPRARAVIPVHLFGQMADMREIHSVAEARGVPVLEDAAQAIGARRDGVRVGCGSACAALSFFPSKNLGAMGDAGMVLTDDAELARQLRRLSNHGQEPKYVSQVLGGNFRLDELQAAILRAKLPYLDGWTTRRQEHAAAYRAAFADARISPTTLKLPHEVPSSRHVYHQFVVRTSQRDALRQYLQERDVATSVYYPVPLHLMPTFAPLGHGAGDFPESERAARESLALPIYPELSASARGRVVAEVLSFFGSRA